MVLKKVEIIMLIRLVFICGFWLVAVIFGEPIIDYLIGYNENLIETDIDRAKELLPIKVYLQAFIYTVLYLIPAALLIWLVVKTISSRAFPPYNMTMPFRMERVIGGKVYVWIVSNIFMALFFIFKALFSVYTAIIIVRSIR